VPKSNPPAKSGRPGSGGRHPKAEARWRYGILGGIGALLVAVIVVAILAFRPKPPPAATSGLSTARWLSTLHIVNAHTAPTWPDVLPPALQVKHMPTVLYIGADWCPYCAAERWPLAIALSRFGRFTHLPTNRSSSTDVFPDTVTWSFYGSRYKSAAIRLVTFETATRQGPTHPLQTPTPTYLGVFNTLDAPPRVPVGYNDSIPFVLVGGKYLWIGTSYSPSLLAGQTWGTLIPSIRTNQAPMGPVINANANALTAAICLVDGGRPASVCRNPVIDAMSRKLASLPVGR
jgi:thiol-disulfide isomerase/thioredoxin